MSEPRNYEELRDRVLSSRRRIEAAAVRAPVQVPQHTGSTFTCQLDRDMAEAATALPPSPSQIMRRVAAENGVSVEDLRRYPRRHYQVRWAVLAAVVEAFPKSSLHRLARLVGRDHSTVHHALRRMGLR